MNKKEFIELLKEHDLEFIKSEKSTHSEITITFREKLTIFPKDPHELDAVEKGRRKHLDDNNIPYFYSVEIEKKRGERNSDFLTLTEY